MNDYNAIVIGTSAGGGTALKELFCALPIDFQVPIIIVQHITPTFEGNLFESLKGCCGVTVKEAEDMEKIRPATIYYAPGRAN